MKPRYFDAHCHLQFDAYAKDQRELIAKMRTEDVAGIVVGCDAESSRKATELAGEYGHLYASVGFHPNRITDEGLDLSDKATGYQKALYDEHLLRNLLMYQRVVAIGECGLDYYRPAEVTVEVKTKQKEIFIKHVELAGATNRPLIIHARPSKGTQDAYHDVIAILREAKQKYPSLRGDIHFFVGRVEEARAFFDLNFTVSFTAVITFARDYDEVIKFAPLDRVLTETDSPYVPPASRGRGERNDPLAVAEVAAKIAEIRGQDFDQVREALVTNALTLFGVGESSIG